jgi:polyketide synthase PksN
MTEVQKSASPSIFLTGATGVLGARILKDLLSDTQSKIYCLVRAANPAEGMNRIQTFLNVYEANQNISMELAKRVEIVLGDIANPFLGLQPEAYRILAQNIDCTIHAAASTNLFLTYRRIEAINVQGVQNIINFVLTTKEKRLHSISTFTVIGDKLYDSGVNFSENDLDIGQGFEDQNYQRSKFVAEQLIRKHTSEGLSWNIYRPGQIFGDSVNGNYPSGKTNVSGLFLDIFKTVIETGIAFESDGHFDITPVDYVSRAIVALALQRNTPSETYHLLNPHPLTYTGVINLLKGEGYPIKHILQSEYKAMLESPEFTYKSATTFAFRSWLSKSNFDFRVTSTFDSRETVAKLRPFGIVCPPIDQKLMHTYVMRGIEEGYFPKPPTKL